MRTMTRAVPCCACLVLLTLTVGGEGAWAAGGDKRLVDGIEFTEHAGLHVTAESVSTLFVPRATDPWQPAVMNTMRGGVEVFASVAPAVIVVRTASGHGSGFLIDADGRLLTNHHVVASGTYVDAERSVSYAEIHLGQFGDDGRMRLWPDPVPAVVLAVDPARDLALLRFDEVPEPLKTAAPVAMAEADPRPGQSCAIVGHPSSGMLWTLRQGDVSAMGEIPRDMVNLLLPMLASTGQRREQIEAALATAETRDIVLSSCLANAGDSGGPLVDESGRLIGVTFGIPGEASESKFTYHVALSEVREFLDAAPNTPLLLVPDAWALGPQVQLIDPRVLVAGGPLPDKILFDVDGDTPRKLIAQQDYRALVGERRFDAELVFHGSAGVRSAFYDRNNDGTFDLILADFDPDEQADRRYRLGPDAKWQVDDGVNVAFIDASLFEDESLVKDAIKLLKKLDLQ